MGSYEEDKNLSELLESIKYYQQEIQIRQQVLGDIHRSRSSQIASINQSQANLQSLLDRLGRAGYVPKPPEPPTRKQLEASSDVIYQRIAIEIGEAKKLGQEWLELVAMRVRDGFPALFSNHSPTAIPPIPAAKSATK